MTEILIAAVAFDAHHWDRRAARRRLLLATGGTGKKRSGSRRGGSGCAGSATRRGCGQLKESPCREFRPPNLNRDDLVS